MKTYKHIFEELLKEENITQCFHDAAKRKTTRPEVARVLKEEREVGNDRPEPQCLQEHVKALQKMLEEETYQPPEHKKMLINEYSCGKVREIIKPEFQYEQVVHHCIIKQLQPIVLHGLYEHALGSIPNRGCHSGKKQVEKWIKAYKGKKFYILKADVRHCFDTEDIRVIETKLKRVIKKVNWYDASAMLASMGWFTHTDTYGFYEDHIKPYVNIKQLKKKVSKHSKKGVKNNDVRMVSVRKYGQADRVGHDIKPDSGLSAKEHCRADQEGH